MSAINGIFERRGGVCSQAALNSSFESLANYGTCDGGQWISSAIGFGHQKTPLTPGDQLDILPFYDATSCLAITSDVRIDNRPELCDELGISANEQKRLTDSGLILNIWQKWGRDCPKNLIGDYSFAIWDTREQTLFCARDHVGVKPFYYSLSPERFVFASDIKGVLAVPDVSDRLDEDFIIASLADKRFYLKDRTYFSEIRRLAPGHTLTVKKDRVKLEKYWFPENSKQIRFANEEDYANTAREIYKRAVTDRVRTKEKIGVHLSGGLDSSSVTVLTAQERRRLNLSRPEVFSWQPPPEDQTSLEREYSQIEAICKQEKLFPHYCPMNAGDILEILKKDPTRQPIHITLPIENTIQKEAAKRGIRLILSGWGGDEALSYSGRGYYADLLLKGRWWKLFREGHKHGGALKFISTEAFLLLFSDRNRALKVLNSRSLKPGNLLESFVRSDLKKQVKLHKVTCRQASLRSTMFWLWDRGMLAERMESWAANAAPLKIKYAYPMLDRRLMEFVAGLPSEQFIGEKWQRWIMRKTMDGILPPEVCWQPDKNEPIRVEKGLIAVYEALSLARDQIESADKSPSGADYLEMDRLLANLRAEALARRPKQAILIRTLQFLDF